MRNNWLITALFAASTILISGCSTGGFGSELSATPHPTAVSASAATLSVPKAEKFSIAIPMSSRQPGLGGDAKSDSSADPSGNATATASMEGNGKSNAGFQLGHAFKNESASQADFEFTVRYKFECEASGDRGVQIPDASVELMLYGRNGHNRLVREQSLITANSAAGPVKRSNSESATITITVGPGETATVYLAGLVKVETPENRSARANLKLSEAQIELTSHPAPASDPKPAGRK